MSNFSFSHSVFKSLTSENKGLFGMEIVRNIVENFVVEGENIFKRLIHQGQR